MHLPGPDTNGLHPMRVEPVVDLAPTGLVPLAALGAQITHHVQVS